MLPQKRKTGVPMPRTPRVKSISGVYHVIMRGIGRQLIFEDDSDRRALLDKLAKLGESGLVVYAWCLMANHFHLLVREGNEPIGVSMKRLGVSYAMHFNLKTGHVGHVFQDRFASEPVEDDEYLLTVVRYIHNNPEKAGMCAHDAYPWSSYREYLGSPVVCDTSLVLDMVGGPKRFADFSSVEDGTQCLDVGMARRRLSDAEALAVAKGLFGPNLQDAFGVPDRFLRDERLRCLREAGVSIRQAERLTGIGRKPISTAYALERRRAG